MSKVKSTIHNIYVDASVRFKNKKVNESCFGLYDSHNKFEMSKVIKATDINDAEARGVLEALYYLKSNNLKGRVFTDSQWAFDNMQSMFVDYELIWIPRELNSKADSLAGKYVNYSSDVKINTVFKGDKLITTETKTSKITIDRLTKIKELIKVIKNYPLNHRLALIKAIGESSNGNMRIYNNLIKNIGSLNKRCSSSYIYLIKHLVPELVVSTESIYYQKPKPTTVAVIELLRRVK